MDTRGYGRGFTLLEMAVVLVIVGLVMGGVLQGQTLIGTARVRNLIAQQAEVTAAFYGFQDRYRALPGDYASASTNIVCGTATCLDGDGNGLIEAPNGAGLHEEILAWNHLSAAGFLVGSYSMASSSTAVPDRSNTPGNAYGVYLQLASDANWGPSGNAVNRINLKTGNMISVQVLEEVDRKIDDGQPYLGRFQFSAYAPQSTTVPNAATCVTGDKWNILGEQNNCGAATTL